MSTGTDEDFEEQLRTLMRREVADQLVTRRVALTTDSHTKPLGRGRYIPGGRRLLVAALTVIFTVGLVGVVVAVRLSSSPPGDVLLTTGSGPCTGAPAGCGSDESSASALAAGTWSRFPDGPLAPRNGQDEVWTGTELIVWGGDTARSPNGAADGAAYNPATQTWRLLPSAPLSGRSNAAAAWTGTEMVVVGGESFGQALADAAAYSPTTNTWRRLPPMPTGSRAAATAHWTGRQLLIVGGESSADMNTLGRGVIAQQERSILAYDPSSNTWTTLPPMPVVRGVWQLATVTSAWTGNELLVWATVVRFVLQPNGGESFQEQQGFGLPAGARRWRILPPPIVQTGDGATAWTGSSVLVMGGNWSPQGPGQPPVGTGASYDPATARWTPVPGFAVRLPQWPAVWTGRAFVDTNRGQRQRKPWGSNRLSVYDPASGRWLALQAAPAGLPANESAAEAVWTGHQLLVWGQPSERLTAKSTSAPPPNAVEPSCWSGPVQLTVTDPISGHGRWPLIALHQFVVLKPESHYGQALTDLRPLNRAAIFEPQGRGWRLAGYLPIPAPNSSPSSTRAVIQFSGAYSPATRYLIDLLFRVANTRDPTFRNLNKSTVSLCTTVETEGTQPGVTTVVG